MAFVQGPHASSDGRGEGLAVFRVVRRRTFRPQAALEHRPLPDRQLDGSARSRAKARRAAMVRPRPNRGECWPLRRLTNREWAQFERSHARSRPQLPAIHWEEIGVPKRDSKTRPSANHRCDLSVKRAKTTACPRSQTTGTDGSERFPAIVRGRFGDSAGGGFVAKCWQNCMNVFHSPHAFRHGP